jgi:diacylglycerol O-acyltransferase / wax synthase
MPGFSKREILSPVDAAWFHMDTPTNMAMITGVMMFSEPLDIWRLKEVVEHRLLQHGRFRQRVHRSFLGVRRPSWEIDPHFDLNAHIRHIALPAPGDVSTLQSLVGDLMGTPLDPTKPLWQLHVVDNFNGGSALVCRLHHCIADGLALVQVLLATADLEPDAPLLAAEVEVRRGGGSLGRLLKSITTTMNWTTRGAELLLRESPEAVVDPSRLLTPARMAADGVAALGKLVFTLPDRRTILRGRCGVAKRAVWTAPMPVSEVKAIGNRLGCTVNDVLLAAVSGALGRYLEGRGQPTDGLDVRTMVPVDLRRPEEANELGNRFGLVIVALPVGVRDPQERMAVLKQRMDTIKNTPEAVVAFGLLNTMGMTPIQVERLIIDFFAAKVSAVMTNVPGPREPLYLAGSRIQDMMFWVPAPGSLSLGISILSYAGNVMVGVATDAGLIPDPEAIVEGIHAELAEMRQHLDGAARMSEAQEEHDTERCHGLTKTGLRCKNRALPGKTTCRIHSGEAL